jgi:hypothetical protein
MDDNPEPMHRVRSTCGISTAHFDVVAIFRDFINLNLLLLSCKSRFVHLLYCVCLI